MPRYYEQLPHIIGIVFSIIIIRLHLTFTAISESGTLSHSIRTIAWRHPSIVVRSTAGVGAGGGQPHSPTYFINSFNTQNGSNSRTTGGNGNSNGTETGNNGTFTFTRTWSRTDGFCGSPGSGVPSSPYAPSSAATLLPTKPPSLRLKELSDALTGKYAPDAMDCGVHLDIPLHSPLTGKSFQIEYDDSREREWGQYPALGTNRDGDRDRDRWEGGEGPHEDGAREMHRRSLSARQLAENRLSTGSGSGSDGGGAAQAAVAARDFRPV